jgi:hypothetical protein
VGYTIWRFFFARKLVISDQIFLQFNQDFSEMHINNGGEFDGSGTWVAHDATGWVPRLLAPAAPEVNDLAALIGESGDDRADLEFSGEEELEAGDDIPLFFVPIGGASVRQCPNGLFPSRSVESGIGGVSGNSHRQDLRPPASTG